MPGLEALLPTTEDMSDASGLQSAPAGTNQLHTVVTSGSSDVVSSNDDSTRRTLLDLRQEKKMRRKGVGGQERPLQLLDLPVDVLKEIVKEVSVYSIDEKTG